MLYVARMSLDYEWCIGLSGFSNVYLHHYIHYKSLTHIVEIFKKKPSLKDKMTIFSLKSLDLVVSYSKDSGMIGVLLARCAQFVMEVVSLIMESGGKITIGLSNSIQMSRNEVGVIN